MKPKTKSILKTIIVISIYIAVIAIVWGLLKRFKLNSVTTLRKICNNSIWGYIIFILLQIIQVIFLPLNNIIFTIPAIVIFGPVKAFVLCYVGLVLGSIAIFLICRWGGIGVLKWIAGEEKAIKYTTILGKGKFMFPIFMLLAIIPDDILCACAGLSNIEFNYFFFVILCTRAIDLACTCFIGTHVVKSPLGIALLTVFLIIAIIISTILTKNQEKVENFLVKVFSKEQVPSNKK